MPAPIVHGRTQTEVKIENHRKRVVKDVAVDPQHWAILLKDHHEGYISWEDYQFNQAIIAENANKLRPRCGVQQVVATRSWWVYCAVVIAHASCTCVTRGIRPRPTNATVRRFSTQAPPRCIRFGAMRIEQAVVTEVLHVLGPSGIEAALQAATQLERRAEEQHRHLELALDQARFEAERARRQYDLAEPENRLVARELERRWSEALQMVRQHEAHSGQWRKSRALISRRRSARPSSISGVICRMCGIIRPVLRH